MQTEKALFGVYRNDENVKTAIKDLCKIGFVESDIGVFRSKTQGSQDFAQVQKSEFQNGAIIGFAMGAVISAVGSLAILLELIPSPFPYHLSTPVSVFVCFMCIIFGGAIGAAAGALVGIGTPDSAGERYGQYLQSGGILVSVSGGNQRQNKSAEMVLRTSGAQDIHRIDKTEGWFDAIKEQNTLEESVEYKSLHHVHPIVDRP